MDADIITVKEAAARLHVAVNTIYNWITDGRLTYQDGLFRVRLRTLFHWPTLKARALSGSLDRGTPTATKSGACWRPIRWLGCTPRMDACC